MPRKSILIASLAAAGVIGGLAYWALPGEQSVMRAPPRAEAKDKNSDTIAYKWQWQNFSKSESAPDAGEDSEVSANVVLIYRILQSMKLDENGRVVPDQTMKEALEQGFDELGPNLNAAAMSELQTLIRTGLAGQAGEEAAQILENYYRFRLAEREFEGQPLDQTPADRYEELVQLRRSYLGAETADKLFEVEDTNGRHMLAAIAIQTNANLTDEEKQTQQQALQEQLNDRLLALGLLAPEEAAAEKVQRLREEGASSADIYATRKELLSAESARDLAAADREEAAWQSRFNGFWQARRYVVQAGLDEVERERQIEQLFEQYFSPEERERARLTSSDWQARDAK
ncbi:lipase secretion chaperone [Peristeroidobacter agariperforans]|uniref:lipase secretion chaperone n=1 Tax=Peristeroidobacter agariperforans TaxID=268404 RepID=UPI00101CCFFC|nr:lipase secretion chaperone [Peristeroidobacter agariperforans]